MTSYFLYRELSYIVIADVSAQYRPNLREVSHGSDYLPHPSFTKGPGTQLNVRKGHSRRREGLFGDAAIYINGYG